MKYLKLYEQNNIGDDTFITISGIGFQILNKLVGGHAYLKIVEGTEKIRGTHVITMEKYIEIRDELELSGIYSQKSGYYDDGFVSDIKFKLDISQMISMYMDTKKQGLNI
jgi:hypothetical protein